MDESTIAEILRLLIEENEGEDAQGIKRVASFEEEGVMTMNRGLVIETDDGRKFQVTIVRSR